MQTGKPVGLGFLSQLLLSLLQSDQTSFLLLSSLMPYSGWQFLRVYSVYNHSNRYRVITQRIDENKTPGLTIFPITIEKQGARGCENNSTNLIELKNRSLGSMQCININLIAK